MILSHSDSLLRMIHLLRCLQREWVRSIIRCTTAIGTATHCNALHRNAPRCTTLQHTASLPSATAIDTATHCNTLHHNATHCNTQIHCTTCIGHFHRHCNTLHRNATHRSTLQHLHQSLPSLLQHIAPHGNTMQHTTPLPSATAIAAATHCNTLQHMSTHCSTLHHFHQDTAIATATQHQGNGYSIWSPLCCGGDGSG